MTVEEAQEYYGNKARQALQQISQEFYNEVEIWPIDYEVIMATFPDPPRPLPSEVNIKVAE